MTPPERMARAMIRLLLEEVGHATVVRLVDEEAPSAVPPTPIRPRRRPQPTEDARRRVARKITGLGKG